ncbi:MAG: transposase [Pseudomonadota bacterium]
MATVREALATGVARSTLTLTDLDLPVSDQTTLARRKRTVSLDMQAPGRTAPLDVVHDGTGLTFSGPDDLARRKHGEQRGQ